MINLLTNLLNGMGLIVTNDGYVKIESGSGKHPVLVQGKPLVLPTKDHIDTLVSVENGIPKTVKKLFNPFADNVLAKDRPEVTHMKSVMELTLTYRASAIARMLISLARDEKQLKNVPLYLQQDFLAGFIAKKGKKKNELIDAGIPDKFQKIFDASCDSPSTFLVKIFIKKSVNAGDGKTAARKIVLNSKVLDMLDKVIEDKKGKVFEVPLVARDARAIKHIITYAVKGMNEPLFVMPTSIPTVKGLTEVFINLTKHFNKIAKDLKSLDLEAYDVAYNKLGFTLEDINNATTTFKSAIAAVPDDAVNSTASDASSVASKVSAGGTADASAVAARLTTMTNPATGNIDVVSTGSIMDAVASASGNATPATAKVNVDLGVGQNNNATIGAGNYNPLFVAAQIASGKAVANSNPIASTPTAKIAPGANNLPEIKPAITVGYQQADTNPNTPPWY